jgi:hypothetical protein
MKNSLTVTSFTKHLTKKSDSWLTCKLSNGKFMDVSLYSFFYFATENDKTLKSYSNKFEEWEHLLNDLETLNYDYLNILSGYVQCFDDEEILDLSYFNEEI